MTDPNESKTDAGVPSPAAPCSAIPRYFAGVFRIEETVSGGIGQTPDDAVQDYFANHADDEIDYYTDIEQESGTITVEVFEVCAVSPDDEENYGGWQWMCGKQVEKREYHWRIETDSDFPRIVYVPNAKIQGMSAGNEPQK